MKSAAPIAAISLALAVACGIGGVLGLPALAAQTYGASAPNLGRLQTVEYSARLLWADGLLTKAPDPMGAEADFEIRQGEAVGSICQRLEQAGLVLDAGALKDYMIYKGLDTTVRSGVYRLSGRLSAVEVAYAIQDPTPADVDFVVLPGWRLEEIADSLPTSGLSISPSAFISAASRPLPDFAVLTGASTTEGFLYPDTYVIPRATDASSLVGRLVSGFSAHLDTNLAEGFAAQSLTVYQAVTLASIVEREAVVSEEAPIIASVYLNRFRASMRLDADPTVQYSLGFNSKEQTWWTNPLTLADLRIDSPYNTYLYSGLPPSPISNPGMPALQAVAYPASTGYLFFSARCDGSGYHNFAETFEEHLRNLCP